MSYEDEYNSGKYRITWLQKADKEVNVIIMIILNDFVENFPGFNGTRSPLQIWCCHLGHIQQVEIHKSFSEFYLIYENFILTDLNYTYFRRLS